jgi:hypothetical protein
MEEAMSERMTGEKKFDRWLLGPKTITGPPILGRRLPVMQVEEHAALLAEAEEKHNDLSARAQGITEGLRSRLTAAEAKLAELEKENGKMNAALLAIWCGQDSACNHDPKHPQIYSGEMSAIALAALPARAGEGK